MRREKNRIAAQKSRMRQTQKADSLHLVRRLFSAARTVLTLTNQQQHSFTLTSASPDTLQGDTLGLPCTQATFLASLTALLYFLYEACIADFS